MSPTWHEVEMSPTSPAGSVPASIRKYFLPNERSFFVVRHHSAILLGPASLLLAGLVVAGLLSGVLQGSSGALWVTWLAWGFLFLYFMWALARWFTDYLGVTSERMLIVKGVVIRQVTMMPLRKADDLVFQRSKGGRLLRYGKFTMETPTALQNRVLPIEFVPFPEVFDSIMCFGPDAPDVIKHSVLDIRKAFDPVSPFKIARMLEWASENQGPDSLAVPRERFYRRVADRVESSERRPALRSYLDLHRDYLSQRSILESAGLVMRYLTVITIASTIGLGCSLWIEHYDVARQVGQSVSFDLFLAAVAALVVLLPGLFWVVRRRINIVDNRLMSIAELVNEQILQEFQDISLELSQEVKRAERGSSRMLGPVDAPTLVEIESLHVQPSASFRSVIEFLRDHSTSAVGVAGPRGAGSGWSEGRRKEYFVALD
jgi:hypothetical protein